MSLNHSSCQGKNQGFIPRDIMFSFGIKPRNVYDDPQGIASIAVEVQARNNRNFCLLPFCHTTEAGAMGADIHPADYVSAPRAGSYVLAGVSELSAVKIADYPPIKNLLSACRLLKGEGKRIVYELCGPISILSCLMDLSVFFSQWRKDQNSVAHTFQLIKNMLSDFLSDICRTGVYCVSYADPAGNPDILGPRYGKLLTEQFVLPFLKAAVPICKTHGVALSICPLTASALDKYGALSPGWDNIGQISVCCINSAGQIPEGRIL